MLQLLGPAHGIHRDTIWAIGGSGPARKRPVASAGAVPLLLGHLGHLGHLTAPDAAWHEGTPQKQGGHGGQQTPSWPPPSSLARRADAMILPDGVIHSPGPELAVERAV